MARIAPRRGPATAAATTAAAVVAVLALSGCAPTEPGRQPSSPPASAPTASPAPSPSASPSPSAGPGSGAAPEFEMSVGDCFDVRKDEMSRAAGLVSCDVEHDDEVYAVYELPAETAYPETAEQFFAAPFEGCAARFGDFVGLAYGDSALEVTLQLPSPDQWAAGDRRIWCLVYNPNDTTIGSLAGAGY
jgi:hypothetical protein